MATFVKLHRESQRWRKDNCIVSVLIGNVANHSQACAAVSSQQTFPFTKVFIASICCGRRSANPSLLNARKTTPSMSAFLARTLFKLLSKITFVYQPLPLPLSLSHTHTHTRTHNKHARKHRHTCAGVNQPINQLNS